MSEREQDNTGAVATVEETPAATKQDLAGLGFAAAWAPLGADGRAGAAQHTEAPCG